MFCRCSSIIFIYWGMTSSAYQQRSVSERIKHDKVLSYFPVFLFNPFSTFSWTVGLIADTLPLFAGSFAWWSHPNFCLELDHSLNKVGQWAEWPLYKPPVFTQTLSSHYLVTALWWEEQISSYEKILGAHYSALLVNQNCFLKRIKHQLLFNERVILATLPKQLSNMRFVLCMNEVLDIYQWFFA